MTTTAFHFPLAILLLFGANVQELQPWGPYLLTLSNILLWDRLNRLDNRIKTLEKK